MLETSPIDACKAKVTEAKLKILSNYGYTQVCQIILQHHPKYNTAEGGELIKAVWQKRKADYALTEILEQIANGKLKLKKANK